MTAGFHGVWAAALLGCVATAGCVIGTAEAQGASAARAEPVAVATVQSPAADLDLGSDADRTCFLLGLGGSLDARGTVASAGVYRADGHWIVRTRAGSGAGVGVQVACVAQVANRVELAVTEGAAPSVPATADRHCFLTSVTTSGRGWDAELPAFPFGPPGVKIEQEGAAFVFRAWLGKAPTAGASAVCVDIPAGGLRDFHWIGPQSRSGQLFASEGGWTCGLSGVFGVFSNARTEPGAELASGEHGWTMTLGERREAYATCVK